MGSSTPSRRTAGYKPGLALFAALAAGWVFVLVTLGAFTTTINAGMAFPDWPLSNGSLNPQGWLSDLAMFAEHSHRLSAGLMTTLALVIAIWTWRREERAWLRRLAWFAFLLCVAQAIVGGLRVLLNPIPVGALDTNVGQLFAMLHACLGQALVCALLAVAVSSSRGWIERQAPVAPTLRKWGLVCCALVFLQLAIAAVMRHSFAGLAIPYFPFSTRDHHLLPPIWGFKIAIQFAHRVMAVVLSAAVLVFVALLSRDPGATPAMKTAAALLLAFLCLQVLLGGAIIWSFRDPFITTAHVLVGALTLGTIFWLTWSAHRDRLQT